MSSKLNEGAKAMASSHMLPGRMDMMHILHKERLGSFSGPETQQGITAGGMEEAVGNRAFKYGQEAKVESIYRILLKC
jgi:hypothetical protein